MTNPLDIVAAHVVKTRPEDLPAEVTVRVKTFLLDTLGVGIAGSSGAQVPELITLAKSWGAQPEATVLATGERMSAQTAALVNAYQIHCLEFDCVHEGAVLHPMATILSAVMAWVERESTHGRRVAGADLIAALAVGVDVSTMLGIVTESALQFFRPALAGGFGAVAAIGKLAGFDQRQMKDAFGAQYAQASGTLQPHVEGSPMLGLQVGFNARAAVNSTDLAQAGFRGPHDILTGQYGYFKLFEQDNHDIDAFLPTLGHDWQVLHLSHKPYPSGRLTHGAVDGLGRLMRDYGFVADDIASVTALVPALVHRLVGRPDIPEPDSNYAKLCLRFVAGTFLAHGNVDVLDFRGAKTLADVNVHRYAHLIDVVLDDNSDQNALTPQLIKVTLKDGAQHEVALPQVYGHPDEPMSEAENIAKFRRCMSYGRATFDEAAVDALITAIDNLEGVTDVADIMRLCHGDSL
jgi:2-methylcitrate dehydratase PrpD